MSAGSSRPDRAETRAPDAEAGPQPAAGQHPRRVLFSVAFRSQLTDRDLARLNRALDLVTYMTPKPGVSAGIPGVARLDPWSGLFLEPAETEGEWVLEGRTWGNPSPEAVQEWHIQAALAARELDPAVELPRRRGSPEAAPDAPPAGRRRWNLVRRAGPRR